MACDTERHSLQSELSCKIIERMVGLNFINPFATPMLQCFCSALCMPCKCSCWHGHLHWVRNSTYIQTTLHCAATAGHLYLGDLVEPSVPPNMFTRVSRPRCCAASFFFHSVLSKFDIIMLFRSFHFFFFFPLADVMTHTYSGTHRKWERGMASRIS